MFRSQDTTQPQFGRSHRSETRVQAAEPAGLLTSDIWLLTSDFGRVGGDCLDSRAPASKIIDFARILPGLPKAKVFSRIVMTPQHSLLLHNALADNIKKYEERFGKIKLHGKEEDIARSMGF
jgi:hypothetical protein